VLPDRPLDGTNAEAEAACYGAFLPAESGIVAIGGKPDGPIGTEIRSDPFIASMALY
jgi:hypothetical protein